jgi:hypothetical protein
MFGNSILLVLETDFAAIVHVMDLIQILDIFDLKCFYLKIKLKRCVEGSTHCTIKLIPASEPPGALLHCGHFFFPHNHTPLTHPFRL